MPVGSVAEVVWERYVLVEPTNPQGIAEGAGKVYTAQVTTSETRTFTCDECAARYLEICKRLVPSST